VIEVSPMDLGACSVLKCYAERRSYIICMSTSIRPCLGTLNLDYKHNKPNNPAKRHDSQPAQSHRERKKASPTLRFHKRPVAGVSFAYPPHRTSLRIVKPRISPNAPAAAHLPSPPQRRVRLLPLLPRRATPLPVASGAGRRSLPLPTASGTGLFSSPPRPWSISWSPWSSLTANGVAAATCQRMQCQATR
jgi:hypothetical protein